MAEKEPRRRGKREEWREISKTTPPAVRPPVPRRKGELKPGLKGVGIGLGGLTAAVPDSCDQRGKGEFPRTMGGQIEDLVEVAPEGLDITVSQLSGGALEGELLVEQEARSQHPDRVEKPEGREKPGLLRVARESLPGHPGLVQEEFLGGAGKGAENRQRGEGAEEGVETPEPGDLIRQIMESLPVHRVLDPLPKAHHRLLLRQGEAGDHEPVGGAEQ